jgi:hypothetical protein
MYIIIRGHIRNSFTTNDLYNLIKYLSEKYTIKIYIHTWSIKQNNISWRPIENDFTEINIEYFQSYFKDLFKFIKKIIIDDDSNIKLYGIVDGKMALSKTNILGWKRYIYGQHKIIKYLYNKKDNLYNKKDNENKFLLNIRFDLFTNSFIFPYDEIINFINNNYNNNHKKNIFLRDGEYCGIDNIIIGTIKTNYQLISFIHYNLDDILVHNKNLEHPEFIISRVNNLIFK